MISKLSIIESIILGVFFLVVFLPVRLLFFTFVSEHWFGNLGVLSIMMFLIVYLSQKGKLGYIGRLVLKKLNKIKHSKITKFFIIAQLIAIYIIGSSFIAVSSGESSIYLPEIEKQLMKQNMTTPETFTEHATDKIGILEFLIAIPFSFIIPILNFDFYAGALHSVDNIYNGWFSHFLAIALIEILESFIILIYFRFVRK